MRYMRFVGWGEVSEVETIGVGVAIEVKTIGEGETGFSVVTF